MKYDLPPPEIHDRGRGPEIKGTRITVYDIMDYYEKHPPEWIAELLHLTVPHVELAIRYINEHKDELMPAYQEGLDAAARGNPPHIRARLAESHERLMAKKREFDRLREAEGRARGAVDAESAG